jgi:hypothetical protein
MPSNPLQQLRELAARIQNLPTTEQGASFLNECIREAVALLSQIEEQNPGRVALRCQVSRLKLQTEVVGYLTLFEKATDKREQITRITQARAQAHYVIWQVLLAATR